MNIQAAIKACYKRKDLFARPQSWQGSGEAIDLAKRCNSDSIRRVQAIRAKTFLTSEWLILPEELLCSWQIVSLDALTEEVEKSGARKNREAG